MKKLQINHNPLWPVLRLRSGIDWVYSAARFGRVFTRENNFLEDVSLSSGPFTKYSV